MPVAVLSWSPLEVCELRPLTEDVIEDPKPKEGIYEL